MKLYGQLVQRWRRCPGEPASADFAAEASVTYVFRHAILVVVVGRMGHGALAVSPLGGEPVVDQEVGEDAADLERFVFTYPRGGLLERLAIAPHATEAILDADGTAGLWIDLRHVYFRFLISTTRTTTPRSR